MRSAPLTDRLVEVIADFGESAVNGRYRYGSGCIVRGRTVLTAAHVVDGAGEVLVRDVNKRRLPAVVVEGFVGDIDGPAPDLALIEIINPDVDFPPLPLARVDRESQLIEPVERCHALGYPWFAQTPSKDGIRDTVDAVGVVPVLSKLATGLLSVQVTIAPQELPPGDVTLDRSVWSGISGGPVVAAGMLLGVVIEHAPREGQSTITATPLTALERDAAHPLWGAGVADPAAWWARLGVTSLSDLRRLPPPPLQRRRPAYLATLGDFCDALHRRMSQLIGRERDLADITTFAMAPGGYRWLVAGAYSGKTALLVEAVTAGLPDSVDVASYFLTRRGSDADSSRFLHAVVPQLAYLCDMDPQPGDPRDQFKDLWQRASERATELKRPLLLVVDGLDEDLRPAGSPSVASLLPARTVGLAHVLVSSRPNPGLPVDVPDGHSLRSEEIRQLLEPFEGAGKLSRLAEQEIYALTHGTEADLAVETLGILTAARGPLTLADLATLTSTSTTPMTTHVRQVRRLVSEAAVRSLERIGDFPNERYRFAHESLQEYAEQTPDLAAPEFLSRIHDWAQRWRQAGWPMGENVSTPPYLFDAYPGRLSGDPARLAGLVSDPGWVHAAIRSNGVDRVLASLRTASDAQPGRPVWDMLLVVAGQAHYLRSPKPINQPGYVLRQLWMQAAEMQADLLADKLHALLSHEPGVSLTPRWTTRRASRALVAELGRHEGVRAVAVLADGRVVSGGGDGQVLVWNPGRVGDGSVVLGTHHDAVWAVAVLPDGRVVSGGRDGQVLVWNPGRLGDSPIVLGSHDDEMWAVAALPDGRVVSGGADRQVLVWDSGRVGDSPLTLGSHDDAVWAVAVLPDGRVVSAGADRRVLVWDSTRVGDGPVVLGSHHDEVWALAVLPDGRVVSSGRDRRVLAWDSTRVGESLQLLGGHDDEAWAVAVLPDGRVVSGGRDGRVLVWDPNNIGDDPMVLGGHDDEAWAVAVLPDGRVVSAGADSRVLVWDPGRIDDSPPVLGSHENEVRAVAVRPNDSVVSGGADGRLLVWDPDRVGDGPVLLGDQESPVWTVAVFPDGRVVSGGADGRLLVWDPGRVGDGLMLLGRHDSSVWAVVVLPDGRVVSGGADGRLLVWDPGRVADGPVVLGRHDSPVWAVALLPDGRVVSGGADGQVLLWDPVRVGDSPVVLGSHDDEAWAVAVLPDGRVVSAGADGRVLMWDPARVVDGPVLLGSHDDGVRAVAVLPDGRVVSGGADRRVLVWDGNRDAPTAELGCSVVALAALSQGHSIVVAHDGAGMSTWAIRT